MTWDTQLSWKGIKGLNLVVGVKNLADTDPPSSRTEANFQTGYDASFTNPIGRAYYVRVGYKFFHEDRTGFRGTRAAAGRIGPPRLFQLN